MRGHSEKWRTSLTLSTFVKTIIVVTQVLVIVALPLSQVKTAVSGVCLAHGLLLLPRAFREIHLAP
jgi:hypothetical protein